MLLDINNMKKRICFFSVGFAFNRLVRLRFYEKIFPDDVELILYTTDKYKGTEKSNYQHQWTGLSRTQIFVEPYHPINTYLKFRNFCKKNKVDRIINLGFHTAWPILFFAKLFQKSDYCLNILTDIFNQYYLAQTKKEMFKEIFTMIYMWPGVFFAKKAFYTDRLDSLRAPKFFLSKKSKMIWLAAPVNTDFFIPKNKMTSRKKLDLDVKSNIVIFVGRINYLKCSDILKYLIDNLPEVNFIVVGRIIDNDFRLYLSKPNVIYKESLSSAELVDYYNASDIGFCINRGGGGIGLSTEETLSCGTPVIVSKNFKLKESKSLIQITVDKNYAKIYLQKFFELNKKIINELSIDSRKYVMENYSDDVWKDRYITSYLN